MYKQEFIKDTAKKYGLTQSNTEEMLNIFLESISEILAEGKEINLKGFGKFYTTTQAGRTVITPQGEKVRVKSKIAPRFRPSTVLKEAVN